MDAAALMGSAVLETTAATAAVAVADVEFALLTLLNIAKHNQTSRCKLRISTR